MSSDFISGVVSNIVSGVVSNAIDSLDLDINGFGEVGTPVPLEDLQTNNPKGAVLGGLLQPPLPGADITLEATADYELNTPIANLDGILALNASVDNPIGLLFGSPNSALQVSGVTVASADTFLGDGYVEAAFGAGGGLNPFVAAYIELT